MANIYSQQSLGKTSFTFSLRQVCILYALFLVDEQWCSYFVVISVVVTLRHLTFRCHGTGLRGRLSLLNRNCYSCER